MQKNRISRNLSVNRHLIYTHVTKPFFRAYTREKQESDPRSPSRSLIRILEQRRVARWARAMPTVGRSRSTPKRWIVSFFPERRKRKINTLVL